MDVQTFRALGNRVAQGYLRANYDDAAFPEIAAEALAAWEPSFNLEAIVAWLLTSSVPQSPDSFFSDLPARVYEAEHFYIEILIWTVATTSIHQHDFSGAFRHLVGSSIQSEYRFVERDRVSQMLLLGDVQHERTRLLSALDVMVIRSGRAGLIHCLYHLDTPTATLVVRTRKRPWMGPQYGLRPPSAALAELALERTAVHQMTDRALSVLGQLSEEQALALWCQHVVKLDFPTVFSLSFSLDRRFRTAAVRGRLLEAVRVVHGERVDALEACLREAEHRQLLHQTRASITDPDLRFLIALLLNVGERGRLLELVAERDPTRKPRDACVEWLLRLAEPEAVLLAARSMMKRGDWGASPSALATSLVRIARLAPPEIVRVALEAFVDGESEERFRDRPKEGGETSDLREKGVTVLKELRAVPGLRAFVS